MNFESQIEQLTRSTKSVIEDCIVENGAILAANTDMPYYPNSAANYRYVWPRDAAFTLYAADLLGLSADIRVDFVQWLLDRAEGFADTGTIIKRYATNGRHDINYGSEYQPDQAGSMLWSLDHVCQDHDKKTNKVIELLANGLVRQWRNGRFSHPDNDVFPIQDLWEDQTITVSEKTVFTYTLATAVHGIELAMVRLGDEVSTDSESWHKATLSMRETLEQAQEHPFYTWKIPNKPDERQIDASLSGLSWPFALNPEVSNALSRSTIEQIKVDLYVPFRGLKRYIGDRYDGIDNNNTPKAEGAGTWPLLNFWYAIALKKNGMAEAADEIYRETLALLPSDYIPEQILPPERIEKPPTPLAWSHSMFAIASKELGFLD